ncbi:hypothetical protein [Adhaeribacter terreus]|uniref:PH domain-containing protein n=1 Tax=Adhaeribacter terreus TaxID=529703 RepID=A0ABW0ED78_9BACT
MANNILFSEKQRFTQWWLWLILLSTFAMPSYLMYEQLQEPAPFTDPEKNTAIVLLVVIMVPVMLLFALIKLETQISEDGISARLYPLHLKWRHYSWPEIEDVYVREYSPLKEFGGWGLRYGFGGMAYNISGNQGIQIVFKSGKKLLLGTQKPEAATKALKQAQVLAQ